MIKENKLLFLVLLNSLFAFLIDFYLGFSEFWVLILLTEVPILGIIYLAMKGQKWAYILTIIYYFIRSFNLYFPDLYLMTKNGLNFELSINSIGINVVSFIFFILLFYDLKARFNSKLTRIIRGTVIIGIIIIIVAGLITPKDSTYDNNNELIIKRDTTSNFGDQYTISVPENWQTKSNYEGTSFFAVSPLKDSLDRFRENFNIQVYNINFDIYSSEKVAKRLFEQGTFNVPYSIEIVENGFSKDVPEFYTIEYMLSDSITKAQCKMYCKVENGKVYSIIYFDSQETFESNLDVFNKIIKTFKNK